MDTPEVRLGFGFCLIGSHSLPATRTLYTRKGRATSFLLPQSLIAVTHCVLFAAHFSSTEMMEAQVELVFPGN